MSFDKTAALPLGDPRETWYHEHSRGIEPSISFDRDAPALVACLDPSNPVENPLGRVVKLEREKGFEPSTISLATKRSTN